MINNIEVNKELSCPVKINNIIFGIRKVVITTELKLIIPQFNNKYDPINAKIE